MTNSAPCATTGCPRPVDSQGYCRPCSGRLRRSGAIQKLPGRHYLSDVDVAAKTATCVVCGPTRLWLRPRRSPQCLKAAFPNGRGEESRRRQLRQYGLTPEEYEARLAAQGGGCAICGRTETAKGKAHHVDHCHATGEVREILCHYCNTALGSSFDDPALLRAMADYLERHAARLAPV